ncbi:MAG: peptidase [Raoultibacter sp.]
MPAIITHDFFGQDVYHDLHTTIGETRDEYEAFLLGNQGPDPLFYTVINPRLHEFNHLGSTMHDEKPSELIAAFKQGLSVLSEDEYPVGRAYVLGFLCHYTLDVTMHPFVFATQFALSDAGVEGLSRADGHELHGTIESEFDEMVLFTKSGKTVASFDPSAEILRASDFALTTISKLYAYVAMTVYGLFIPADMFMTAAKSFRFVQGVFYSPSGAKRAAIGTIEELFRRHSFFQSMSHRPIELTESQFDNREHAEWRDPFTDAVNTESFWDLYTIAQEKARHNIDMIAAKSFGLDQAQEITGELNFSGEPTTAIIFVEDAPEPISTTVLSAEEIG